MNTNTIAIILGASVLVLAIQTWMKSGITENFGMIPPRTVKTQTVVHYPESGDHYAVPGNFQAAVAPREAGMVDYGAAIRYRKPDNKYLGTGKGSLEITENYCSDCPTGCRVPSTTSTDPAEASASLANSKPALYTDRLEMNPTDLQGQASLNSVGQPMQPVVYQRYIYANQKDRNAGAGDFIRGDLAITPVNRGWFSVSANPQTMLRDGALAVMGGMHNDTGKELMALKTAASGGTLDVGHGVSYSIQKTSYNIDNGAGVKVTAYP